MGELEIRRRKNPKYLRSLLQTRANECKMLNDTLCEAISKNSSVKTIKTLKEEINSVLDEMKKINEDIIYTTYDEMRESAKKIPMKSSFYDSIVKQSKAEDEYGKNYKPSMKYNYENIYKSDNQKLTKEIVDDLRDTVDSRFFANRFLVNLKDALNIPEIMVKSVSFNPTSNRVSVCIYDFMIDYNDKKYPILQVLKYAPTSFSFSIKHLDASGNVLYIERYSRCSLINVYRDPIDYASDDFSKIQLSISYQNVEYETSK